LTESCVLATLGGLGGFMLTAAAWQILPVIVPVSIPRLATARADWTILAFVLAVAFLNGLLFGLAPAIRFFGDRRAIARTDIGTGGTATGTSDRLRGVLVAAEVAITVTLVLTGGQVLDGFVELLRTDPGFNADRVLASVVLPPFERYRT